VAAKPSATGAWAVEGRDGGTRVGCEPSIAGRRFARRDIGRQRWNRQEVDSRPSCEVRSFDRGVGESYHRLHSTTAYVYMYICILYICIYVYIYAYISI
jgi:hypothetical protein